MNRQEIILRKNMGVPENLSGTGLGIDTDSTNAQTKATVGDYP